MGTSTAIPTPKRPRCGGAEVTDPDRRDRPTIDRTRGAPCTPEEKKTNAKPTKCSVTTTATQWINGFFSYLL